MVAEKSKWKSVTTLSIVMMLPEEACPKKVCGYKHVYVLLCNFGHTVKKTLFHC